MVGDLLNFSLLINGTWLKGLIDTLGNITFCNFFPRRLRRKESSKNLNMACPKEAATTYSVYHKCKMQNNAYTSDCLWRDGY